MEEKMKEQKNRKDYWLHEVHLIFDLLSKKNLFFLCSRVLLLK
jgi:hypothetical protein